MQKILDTIFSSGIIIFLIICLTLFIIAILFFKIKFKNQINNIIFKIITISFFSIIIFIPLIINSSVFGFGYIKSFSQISCNGSYLCLLDNTLTGGEDSPNYLRLQVINPETGSRYFRKVLGHSIKFLDQKDNLLFYEKNYNNFIILDLKSQKEKTIINKKNLPKLIPELSAGIDDLKFDTRSKILEFTLKSGYKNYLDPFSMTIIYKNPEIIIKPKQYFIEYDTIRKNEGDSTPNYISLSNDKDNVKIKRLENEKLKIKNENTGFLEGKILEVFPDQKLFMVLSYDTTDKTNFILSCVSFDLKILYQIKQKELNVKDMFYKKPQFYIYTTYNDNFIFNSGGYIFSINVTDGKFNWTTRL